MVNSKIHLATKISSFMENYGRVMNRSRDQEKRKSGKGNRVCRKGEENLGKSGDSTKKSIERNEEVGQ